MGADEPVPERKASMMRVLFVDDESGILEGLRRALRSMRHEWEMEFAPSGREALDRMELRPFDIVVSDMKMPGMDGAELLAEVKRRYPTTIRIILSGYADQAAIMKSIGSTHQYLSKPCEPEVLRKTIERTRGLRTLLTDERLTRLASQLDTLPSLPALYRQIVAEVQRPNASLSRIGEIIAQDMAMSAKILKLVNSAYFGTTHPITSVERATVRLGLETISSLVLGMSIFSEHESASSGGFDIDALWRHSMLTASFARAVAAQEGLDSSARDTAFLGGMLHDIGKLVLGIRAPAARPAPQRSAPEANADDEATERERFDANHAEIGAYLIGLWGLPDPVVEAIAYHHRPGCCPVAEAGALAAVHVADVLAGDPDLPGATAAAADLAYLEAIGWGDHWEAWREACRCAAPQPA